MFACDKKEKEPEPEPAETPELTLTSESEVNVGADGDEVTITYTLANPAEDGEISASAAEGGDWCDGFNCDTDGQVTFTVAANEGDARETVVTVTYTYGEGEHKDITVTVKQVALGDPLFELTSESEVSVSKDGGDVTVTYSITGSAMSTPTQTVRLPSQWPPTRAMPVRPSLHSSIPTAEARPKSSR